jgi:membrane fusion protein (multidrug efflux system)
MRVRREIRKPPRLGARQPNQPDRIGRERPFEKACRQRAQSDSVRPGSGPAFSLLPPENATGNYVKIVQRVPVKVILENPPADVSLGPGMSVVPTVRVDPAPTLYERVRARLEQWWRRA